MSEASTPSSLRAQQQALLRAYWKKNLLLMSACLVVWAIAGLGCGILWADTLNAYMLPGTGYPLGFWFAHQGAIIVFVLIILVYALTMNRLDRVHHEELEALAKKGAQA